MHEFMADNKIANSWHYKKLSNNMLKTIILFITIAIVFNLNGQTLEKAIKALKNINSLNQIEALKKKYPNWNIYKDITVFSDSIRFPEIIKAKVGDVQLKQYHSEEPTYVIKIVAVRDEEFCKLKYICLNSTKLNKKDIDSLRNMIVSKYKNGVDFDTLINAYNMDNSRGELDWFYKGMMVEEIDSAVFNRKKGDIFTVDVKKTKWFYIMLKTHDNKMEKAKVAVMIEYTF